MSSSGGKGQHKVEDGPIQDESGATVPHSVEVAGSADVGQGAEVVREQSCRLARRSTRTRTTTMISRMRWRMRSRLRSRMRSRMEGEDEVEDELQDEDEVEEDGGGG